MTDVALLPGERVLWEGRPDLLRFVFNPMYVFFFVFFAVWLLGFSSVIGSRSPNAPSPLFFLFPALFFGVFFFGPMLISGWLEGSRTTYVLTDRRVLIRGFRRRAEIDLASLQLVELQRSLFGTTSIYFAPRSPYASWGFGFTGSWTPAFRAIADGDRVYDLISRARAEARSR
ncbi:MAG TPA: PH domain-containing protein [Candidatus Limnocylindria bacterium]|jgi:hypothetical protein|nr:PH domain-containing protein [Candidatus Limnocylindria bacterium]